MKVLAVLLTAAVCVLAHPSSSVGGSVENFLSLEMGPGRVYSHPSSQQARGGWESSSARRMALSLVQVRPSGLSGQAQLAWIERRAIFSQVEMERQFVEVSLGPARRLTSQEAWVSLGVLARLDMLLGKVSEMPLGLPAGHYRNFVFGVDPTVSVGYRYFSLTGRYVWDLSASYVTPPNSSYHVRDSGIFLNVGLSVPIERAR